MGLWLHLLWRLASLPSVSGGEHGSFVFGATGGAGEGRPVLPELCWALP